MMQVAVLGLGDFGTALARALKGNEVEVLAVDTDRVRAELLKEDVEHVRIADITQQAALEQLGLAQMDIVVVATSQAMSTSILCVLRLKELGVQRIIAKAENDDHSRVLHALGVTEVMVPAHDSAVRLANKISWANVTEMIELSSACGLMELRPPKSVAGKSLRTSGMRETYNVTVLAVRAHAGAPLEVAANPDRLVPEDGTILVFGEEGDLARLREDAGDAN